MRVTYLVKRWSHHTPAGGYDRLVCRNSDTVIDRPTPGRIVRRTARSLLMGGIETQNCLIDYGVEDALAEWRTLVHSIVSRPDVVHVLYGDEQLNVLIRHRALMQQSALIATFHVPLAHLPAGAYQQRKKVAKSVDVAIVVSRSQTSELQEWFGVDRVFYVPHGIDIQRFHPCDIHGVGKTRRFLVVGTNFRDWVTTHRIMDECNARKLPVQFDVVTLRREFSHFDGCANTSLHEAISEEELITLYQRADALLCPVIEATANNAILEAMACGTPVISTAIGGIPDYVDSSAGWLFEPGEVSPIVDLIAGICQNGEPARSLRKGARLKALTYDWPQIRMRCSEIYNLASDLRSGNSRK